MDGAMAEEKGEGRLTSMVVLGTYCVADLVNTVHVAPVSHTSHVQYVSQCRPVSTAVRELDVELHHWFFKF